MPAELLRENKRMLDKAIRDLDRERMGLQNQEKKLVLEIKKAAKQGQMARAPAPAGETLPCAAWNRCEASSLSVAVLARQSLWSLRSTKMQPNGMSGVEAWKGLSCMGLLRAQRSHAGVHGACSAGSV